MIERLLSLGYLAMFEIQTSFSESEISVVYHRNFPPINTYSLSAFSIHVSLVVLICKSVAIYDHVQKT